MIVVIVSDVEHTELFDFLAERHSDVFLWSATSEPEIRIFGDFAHYIVVFDEPVTWLQNVLAWNPDNSVFAKAGSLTSNWTRAALSEWISRQQ